MIEDGGAYPSRGEPDSGTAPPGGPRYPEWPSAGHAPGAGEQPTDVYAALSDLAPGDLEPGEVVVPPPGHGQPVPRDFVPPQITWAPAPEPLYFDGSLVHWNSGAEPAAPIERFEQRREDWRPAYQPPAQRPPFDDEPSPNHPAQGYAAQGYAAEMGPAQTGPAQTDPAQTDSAHGRPPVEWLPAAETEVFDGPMIDLSAPRPLPVTHRGRRRRGRTVVAVAAVGAVLAGATGYALLRGLGLSPTTRTDAALPAVTLAPTGVPSAGADAPSDPLSIPPSASQRQATSPAASPSTAAATTGGTATPTRTTDPSPPKSATPTESATPLSGRPATATAAPSPAGSLTASLRSEQSDNGYLGTVALTNPGNKAVSGWTVHVTAPGATQVAVVSSGVSVSRSGDTLIFTPSAGAAPIAAGGSLTFAVAVAGSLSGPLSGCQVNGSPCS